MIAIEIRGHKELMHKFDRLKMKKPALRVCKEVAQNLVQIMKSTSPYWLGNLSKSIQSRQTSSGYNIHMLSYGIWQEFGTRPHWVGSTSALHIWGIDKGWDWPSLQSLVARVGTKAHPFIQPSIQTTMAYFDNIASFEIKNVLKESGFSEI